MVQKNKSTLVEKVQTALISIGTTAVVGCCGFLFKANASLSRIEQSLSDEITHRVQQDTKFNAVQLDVVDLKITVAEIKAKQTQNPQ